MTKPPMTTAEIADNCLFRVWKDSPYPKRDDGSSFRGIPGATDAIKESLDTERAEAERLQSLLKLAVSGLNRIIGCHMDCEKATDEEHEMMKIANETLAKLKEGAK